MVVLELVLVSSMKGNISSTIQMHFLLELALELVLERMATLVLEMELETLVLEMTVDILLLVHSGLLVHIF